MTDKETLEEARANSYIDFAKYNKEVDMYSFVAGFNNGVKWEDKHKQETLEEAELKEKEFYKYMAKQDSWKSIGLIIQEFIQLKLKEQQERSYSDEEVLQLLVRAVTEEYNNLNKWFEQFKKK